MKTLSLVFAGMFAGMFEHAEQRSFLPPSMIIEHNLACSKKRTNMDRNYISKNSWTFGSPLCLKKLKQKCIHLFMAPPSRKRSGTTPEVD